MSAAIFDCAWLFGAYVLSQTVHIFLLDVVHENVTPKTRRLAHTIAEVELFPQRHGSGIPGWLLQVNYYLPDLACVAEGAFTHIYIYI